MINNINKVPILIHTMDSYSWCWNYWYTLFKKYVSNHGPIYFLSEEKEPDFVDDVIHIKSGKGEWGERLLKGLDKIDSELFFYTQEDFFASNDLVLSNDLLNVFYSLKMETLHIKHAEFDFGKFIHIQDNLHQLDQTSQYTLNHQFGLWDKNTFKNLILPNETPWQNELNGTIRRNKSPHSVYILDYRWYVDGIRRGILMDRGRKVLIDNNLLNE